VQTISSCKYLLLTGHFLGFLFLNQFPHYRPWSTAGQFKFFPLIAIIHCEALHRPCPQAKNRLDRQTLHHLCGSYLFQTSSSTSLSLMFRDCLIHNSYLIVLVLCCNAIYQSRRHVLPEAKNISKHTFITSIFFFIVTHVKCFI